MWSQSGAHEVRLSCNEMFIDQGDTLSYVIPVREFGTRFLTTDGGDSHQRRKKRKKKNRVVCLGELKVSKKIRESLSPSVRL